MSLRESFVHSFGEEAAAQLEAAASWHERYGGQFRVAVLIVIAYRCFEVDQLRDAHGITSPSYEDFHAWARVQNDSDIDALLADTDLVTLTEDAITKQYA